MAFMKIFQAAIFLAALIMKEYVGAMGQTNGPVVVDNNNSSVIYMTQTKEEARDLHQTDDFLKRTTAFKWSGTFTSRCRLRTTDIHAHGSVRGLLARQAKLIEYTFTIRNREVDPVRLLTGTTNYKLNKWTRVSHSHGQTILALAFNYGVLSLMTLSFGVAKLNVQLAEEPYGCLLNLTESQKVQVILDPVLRDLNSSGPFLVYDGEAVCHQIIKDQGGRAKFTYQCCFKERRTGLIRCLVDHPNNWLGVLKRLISIITICVVLFGVLVVLGFFPGAGVGVNRYVVKLKEPLYKSACIFRGDSIDETHVVAENVIDLREENKFLNTKLDCKYLPSGMKIPIRISEYNILINYEKLLAENSVHVGLWGSLSRAVFLCKIQHVPAFQDCCEANVCGCIRESNPIMWISVCRLIGRVMMVLFLPIPFYARMVLYFLFEEEEVLARRRAAANAGLQDMFEFNVLQSLTPVHPVFLTAYVMYFSAGLVIAYSSVSSKTYRFHQILSDSFRDLKCSYWLAGLRMVTRNFLWPFRTLGIFGVFLGVIFWPLVMPVSIIACLIYCIPLTYLTCRMIINAINPSHTEKPDLELPGELSDDTTGMKHFEADSIMNTCRLLELDSIRRRKFNPCTIQRVLNVVLALVSIFTVYAVMLLVSECANYVLHILVFTTMGIIVNASKVLKYGALIFMVVLYSYDCYNNVYLQYLKLNKALFSEIKGRVKDISEVTMLPSYLQENRGFKSQENSDQADHETEDNLTGDVPKHWTINDLTLFVDNNDIPRIPRKLFEEVCDIEVPGSPGPVYRSLLVATGQFCFIIVFLIFVFLIVLAFGEVYKISPTNQVIATMAGGFVPFIFRRLLKPAEPDIELNSVSFKSKLEEIVVNFWQVWPMHDFKFDIEEKPESLDDGSENDDAATPPVSYLSVKEEESFKRLSVAELMDAPGKERPSSKEIMEKLVRTRSYGPADSQHVDVVIYLPYHADPTYYKVDVPSEGDYVNAEELTVLNFQHQI